MTSQRNSTSTHNYAFGSTTNYAPINRGTKHGGKKDLARSTRRHQGSEEATHLDQLSTPAAMHTMAQNPWSSTQPTGSRSSRRKSGNRGWTTDSASTAQNQDTKSRTAEAQRTVDPPAANNRTTNHEE